MKISVELSLYPLNEDYIPPINQFIDNIKAMNEFEVTETPMSTIIRAESTIIFNFLDEQLEEIFDNNRAALVMKIIKGKD